MAWRTPLNVLRPLPAVLMFLLTACQPQWEPEYDLDAALWLATVHGDVQDGTDTESGNSLTLTDELGLPALTANIRMDFGLSWENRLLDFSLWHADLSGDNDLSRAQRADGQTVGGPGANQVRTDLRVTVPHIAYGSILRHRDGHQLVVGAGLDLLDFDLEVRTQSSSFSQDATVPVLIVQVDGRYIVNRDWSVHMSIRGLNILRMLGIKETVYQVQGEYLDYRLNVDWQLSNGWSARFGWQSFLASVEREDDRVDIGFHGPTAALRLVW